MFRQTQSLMAGLILFIACQPVFAVLKIEVTQGIDQPIPVAIVPFEWKGPTSSPPQRVEEVISQDLTSSGYFSLLPRSDFLSWPTLNTLPHFKDWRMVKVDHLVVGEIRAVGATYKVSYRLYDVLRGEQLLKETFPPVPRQSLRRLAHQISDKIYQALLDEPGVFSTRIAYIVAGQDTAGKPRFSLQIADADGYAPKTIVSTSQPILSPAWSPDGSQIAYATFDGRHEPVTVYVQDIGSGERQKLLFTKDQVSSPAWSPDGTRLAVVISRRGRRDIHVVDLATRRITQLTRSLSSGFTTEPVWSPDGRSIVYTAFLGGRPQLYRQKLAGGRPERLTFEGKYNTRGTFSPDGKRLGMVHSSGAGYHIAVLELETGDFRVLTDTTLDESPTFAPNGRMILFATRRNGRGALAAVSADGRVQQHIPLREAGDAREPAWGPFLLP
jgi:TolB protein